MDTKFKKGDRVEYIRQVDPIIWHPANVFSTWKIGDKWYATLKTDHGNFTEHPFEHIRPLVDQYSLAG